MAADRLLYETRSEAATKARDARLAKWFEVRRWRVRIEDSATRKVGKTEVTYAQGEFWITGDHVFQTPFGYKGRHGFIIQEIDPVAGADIGDPVCFGHAVLDKAQGLYQCFPAGLPPERKHPPAI